MDLVIGSVVIALAAAGVSVGELLRTRERDVLTAVGLFEAGLLGGAACEPLLPGAFAVGTAAGLLIGGWQVSRLQAARRKADVGAIESAADRPSALLVAHDRLDALDRRRGFFQKGSEALALALLLIGAVALIVLGVNENVWQALLTGAALTVAPAVSAVRYLVVDDERWALRSRLEALEGSGDRPALPGAGDEPS